MMNEIKDIKLCNLHVHVNPREVEFVPELAQAFLSVQYDFKSFESKKISYRIIVGENGDNGLFHINCEYSFKTSKETFLEEEIVRVAMEVLEPKIEELIALITLEAGYLQNSDFSS